MTHKGDIKVLREAFMDGARMMRDSMSMPMDRDVERYEKLSQEDFIDMARQFGAGPTIDYIKDMEMRMNGVRRKKNA